MAEILVSDWCATIAGRRSRVAEVQQSESQESAQAPATAAGAFAPPEDRRRQWAERAARARAATLADPILAARRKSENADSL
jgi:hypothetical protein